MRRKWYQVLPWPEPEPEMRSEPEEQPERLCLKGEQRDEVLAAVDSLGDKHRLVVILRYYAGLSNEEIAETLNIPSGTVRSRLHIARQRLKELLQEHEESKTLRNSKEVAA
jgi:RNA polymerase sigma-70 factor (ECF subfamily)